MAPSSISPTVHSVALFTSHEFSKRPTSSGSITLLEGLGVEGDCHAGETVQHRSRLKLRPAPANLRQVHLIALETLRGAAEVMGREIEPGQLGENVTTEGLDLLALSKGTRLVFDGGEEDNLSAREGSAKAIVRLTGLRNPCPQIDNFMPGLKDRFLIKDEQGKIIGRTTGVMGVVESGGEVRRGMNIRVEEPEVWEEMGCV